MDTTSTKASGEQNAIANKNSTVEASLEAHLKHTREVLERVNSEHPTQEDMEEVRNWFNQAPHLWRLAGDLAASATDIALGQISKRPIQIESTKQVMEQMKKHLGWECATPIERMLIEQVVVCWLRQYHGELLYCQYSTSESLVERQYWERRLSFTQGRYLRALETLARLRKLTQVTQLQVSFGKQVNISQGG
jgi:hypothetical protein